MHNEIYEPAPITWSSPRYGALFERDEQLHLAVLILESLHLEDGWSARQLVTGKSYLRIRCGFVIWEFAILPGSESS